MLKNKTVIVTGSTSGIGLETIRLLAENGANLVMNGIRDEIAEAILFMCSDKAKSMTGTSMVVDVVIKTEFQRIKNEKK